MCRVIWGCVASLISEQACQDNDSYWVYVDFLQEILV